VWQRAKQRAEDSRFSRAEKPGLIMQSFTSSPSKARKQSTTYTKTVKTRRRLRHVRYATVNKRVRSLEESSYLNKIGVKKTKAGFEASIYELTAKAYLAILLNSINLDELVMRTDETTASAIFAEIIHLVGL